MMWRLSSEPSFVSLAVKPVGKPDALIGHVRFDERGWETGRRLCVSARAHPRLYPLPEFMGEPDLIDGGYGRYPRFTLLIRVT